MLTKKERIQLKNIAAALPAEPSNVKEITRIPGWKLLMLNPVAMDRFGKPIVRNRTYEIEQYKPVNHYKRMIAAYDRGGIPAIEKYTDEVKARYDAKQKEKEEKS